MGNDRRVEYVGTVQRPQARLKACDTVFPSPVSYSLEDKPVLIYQGKCNGQVHAADTHLHLSCPLLITPQGCQLKAKLPERGTAPRDVVLDTFLHRGLRVQKLSYVAGCLPHSIILKLRD